MEVSSHNQPNSCGSTCVGSRLRACFHTLASRSAHQLWNSTNIIYQDCLQLMHYPDVICWLAVLALVKELVSQHYKLAFLSTILVAERCPWMLSLMTLPTTTEAFLENAKRAHLQASVWKHALNHDPPLVDPHALG